MKVLIIGQPSELMFAVLKEKHGNDVEIYTPEQAKEAGLTMEDFGNIPTIKLISPLIYTINKIEKSGKEKRRERRKNKRKEQK